MMPHAFTQNAKNQMNEQHPNLNYEFYFLFQVEFDSANEHWQEPPSLPTDFAKENLNSIRVDKDKRLFRYAPPPSETGILPSLDEWEKHLQQGWAQILACYTDAFQQITDTQTSEKPSYFKKKIGFFQPLNAFMGVALLIMDETTKAHQISLSTPDGKVTFKPPTQKTPSEKRLLSVTEAFDIIDTMKAPATLEEFEPESRFLDNWQIQLDTTQPPLLASMQPGENYPNPVFAVYGLAHGELPDEAADWPYQLQAFLCSGKAAVFARVLPRLIMQKWQFKRLDIAARQLRQQLDTTNEYYQQKDDAELECAGNKRLEKDLRVMNKISADAKQVLARLDAGTKTLQINQHNLDKHLQRSGQVWRTLDDTTPSDDKYDWQLQWQSETDTPLLDGFELSIRNLRNHATYIQDALTYLDGIRTRWQMHLDGRRLSYEFNIQITLVVLTFIAAFASIIAVITQKPEYVTFLLEKLSNNPEPIIQIGLLLLTGIFILILIPFVLWVSYLGLKFLWNKSHCLLRKMWARFK
jgi:hypothetical protein